MNVSRAVPFGNLPSVLKDHLAAIGLSRSLGGPVAISCCAKGAVTTNGIANDGERAIVVEIDDIEPDAGVDPNVKTMFGAYGGPNPAASTGMDAEVARPIAPRGAIVYGSTSNRARTPRVVVYLRPYMFLVVTSYDQPTISIAAHDAFAERRYADADVIAFEAVISRVESDPDPLTKDERKVMYAYGAIKSGPYRKDELARAFDVERSMGSVIFEATIERLLVGLIEKGFLRRDVRGAVSMTVAGKNTRKNRGGSSW